ncbi:MAG: thiamine pyrophosphate-dependent enzyme [bacterium]|jgi:2-oxoglutarate ferredoxin oxidoreductase subunit beta
MNDRTQIGEYLRYDKLPLFWCPGCSDGIVLGAIVRSFAELGLKKEEIVVVTGIGCWGKADDYLGTHTLHVTHGRALAFATGVKAAKPELTVVALMGDGDCATIGGNHFIHAARRNIGVTAIVVNNLNYGMTGGQYSATTPEGSSTSTSPLGSLEPAFDLCELGKAAGAPFVARSTPYHIQQLQGFIKEAIAKKGFGLVDVMSICPTHYGRRNQLATPVQMMEWLRDHAVTEKAYAALPTEEQAKVFTIGKFVDRERVDLSTKYAAPQDKARQAKEKREGGAGR